MRTTFTSSASTGERLVTVMRNVIVCPRTAIGGVAVLRTPRSTVGAGGGTGIGGFVGGSGTGGGGGGSGVWAEGAVRVFVNVQTTTSPLATAPSAFVPVTDRAA